MECYGLLVIVLVSYGSGLSDFHSNLAIYYSNYGYLALMIKCLQTASAIRNPTIIPTDARKHNFQLILYEAQYSF